MSSLLPRWLAVIAATVVVICRTSHLEAQSQLGGPLPGLTSSELARFNAGKAAFEEIESVADGIGPVFNRDSCVACHDHQATGGGSAVLSTRIGTWLNGKFDPLIAKGGPVIQTLGIQGLNNYQYVGEVVPPEATVIAQRRTPPTFGLGLVDAVPDGYLWLLAIKQQLFTPDIAGWPNVVIDLRSGESRVGRLGWKAAVPNLINFSGDAYKEEMGITTPGWLPDSDGRKIDEENPPQGAVDLWEYNPCGEPNEEDIEDVMLFTDFMSLLAPPARGPITEDVRKGEGIFSKIGCADCHVPTLVTGSHDVSALRFKRFSPYSDFLLHDMGALGDGVPQVSAEPREMRTAPLWGLRTQPAFLHDGRAATIESAIQLHEGQGKKSRAAFQKLKSQERTQLLAFLNSL